MKIATEVGLTHDDPSVRQHAIKNINRMPISAEMTRGLADKNPMVRYLFASNENYSFSEDDIKLIMQDVSPAIRGLAAKHEIKLSEEIIENGLTDSSPYVRLEFIKRAKILTKEQINRGLRDKNPKVKKTFLETGILNFKIDKRISDTNQNGVYHQSLASEFVTTPCLLEKFLTDKMYHVREAMPTHLRIKLSKFQIERGLIDVSPKVRTAFALHVTTKKIALTYKQMERGLTDTSTMVRHLFAKHALYNNLLCDKQINRGLNDVSLEIRHDFVTISAFSNRLNESQIEIALKDVSNKIKLTILQHIEELSPFQIERGLMDKSSDIRARFLLKFEPNKTQIDRAIEDQCVKVKEILITNYVHLLSSDQALRLILDKSLPEMKRIALIKKTNNNFKLTEYEMGIFFKDVEYLCVISNLMEHAKIEIDKRQIEKGLKSKNWVFRSMFARSKNVKLTAAQINRCVLDNVPSIKIAILKRSEASEIKLTKKQINLFLNDPCQEIRCLAINTKTFTPNKRQIENALNDHDAKVRLSIIKRGDITLTPEQIENALKDKNVTIRFSIANKTNFSPTVEQMNRGLNDNHSKIKSLSCSIKNKK